MQSVQNSGYQSSVKGVLRTLSKICYGAFCENSKWLKAVIWLSIFPKSSILELRQGRKYATEFVTNSINCQLLRKSESLKLR